MATITAPAHIITDYFLQLAAGTRSTPYESRLLLQRTGTVSQFNDYYLQTTNAATRGLTAAGYGGAGTLVVFGSGVIGYKGRHR